MHKQPPRHLPHQQRGAVALLLALVLLVGVSTYVLKTLNSSEYSRMASSSDSSLRNARDALLGYALSYADQSSPHPAATPGNLPCPDIDGDGLEDTNNCGLYGESALGHLPWRTLGLPSNNATGCLWYAVSGTFKSSASSAALASVSTESQGLFQIENDSGVILSGHTPADRAIAVIFKPGDAVMSNGTMQARQASLGNLECPPGRVTGSNNDALRYLDQLTGISNATGRKSGATGSAPGANSLPTNNPSVFISANRATDSNATIFNDQMLWISPAMYQPVFDYIDQWVMRRVQQCMLSYGNLNMVSAVRTYPFAAPLNDSAAPSYAQISPHRFGRIPELITGSTWPNDALNASTQCYSWPWWTHWREQIFYAVHKDHTLSASLNLGNDVQLDGSSKEFVLLLANTPIAAQSRSLYSAKGRIQNYLEENNMPLIGSATIPNGSEQFSSTGTAFFNDKTCSDSGCNF